MKKYLFVFLCLLLSSCGSSSPSTGLTRYDASDFYLEIPSAWSILESTSKLIPEPKDGKIVLALSSPEVVGGFSNTMTVLKKVLTYSIQSKQFSDINHSSMASDYFSYALISSKDISFADGNTSSLYIFDAQYNASSPKLRFLQTASICGENTSFFLTIALPLNITDTSRYEEILKSFECK